MADGFNARDQAGNAVPILVDQVSDGVLGVAGKQLVGIVDATIDSVHKLIIDSLGRLQVTKGIGAGQTLSYAAVDNGGVSGASVVVAGVSSLQIYVVTYALVCANATTAQWKSSGGTAHTGAMSFGVNGGIGMTSTAESPFFATVAGEGLSIVAGGSVSITGHVSYFAV